MSASAEAPIEFPEDWSGFCFICSNQEDSYSTRDRLCKTCLRTLETVPFFKNVPNASEYFVSVLPHKKGPPTREELQTKRYSDLLLRGAGTAGKLVHPFEKSPEKRENILSDYGLQCGQPVVWRSDVLTSYGGFESVRVLDLSRYLWSGTLKDLRSWAILAVAINHNIKHLALWTAGNAGFSLARLVYAWNASAPSDQQIQVHCIVSPYTQPETLVVLRALQCRVLPVSTESGLIMAAGQIYNLIESMMDEPESYWHVTDGWDGVGIYMYRLLALQAIHLETPDYVIVPVGTGDLLLGFHLGNQDLGPAAKLVGAIPLADDEATNVIDPFRPKTASDHERDTRKVRRVRPIAPKLTGFYSPLSPCLWHLVRESEGFGDKQRVEFVDVDRGEQIEVGARLMSPFAKNQVASEPSALIAFGALKRLRDKAEEYGKDPKQLKVLVVNSGFGLIGASEVELYSRSIFQFR